MRGRWQRLRQLFADGAHDKGKLASATAYHDFVLEIVRKLPGQVGLQVLPRHWVVEHTFGWMTCKRRLKHDYEKRLDVSRSNPKQAIRCLIA